MILRAESRFVKAIGIAVNHKPASMTVHEPALVIMNKMKNCNQMALAVKLPALWQDDAARRISHNFRADRVLRFSQRAQPSWTFPPPIYAQMSWMVDGPSRFQALSRS
jgi:hypothetical protein